MPKKIEPLAAQAIPRLPIPEKGFRDYSDGGGLRLRVWASGARAWMLFYRVKGSKSTRLIKLADFGDKEGELGLAAARERARTLKAEIREGEDPKRARIVSAAAGSFGELCHAYLEHIERHQAAATVREKRRVLEGDDTRDLRGMVPAEITPYDIARVLDIVEERGSLSMTNHVQTYLSAVFRWAVRYRHGGLRYNPVSPLERRHGAASSKRWLADDEVRSIWRDIDRREVGAPTALKLVLLTAQRPGEVARMEWRHIDGSTWSMPRGYRKRKLAESEPHDAHLSDLALETLDVVKAYHARARRPGHREFVFPGDAAAGHIDAKALSHAARRIRNHLRKSGAVAEPWKAHDLRRTAATHMRKYLEADRLTVQKILGHKDEDVTGVYDRHDMWPERVAALDAWADRLREIVGDD
jgi:integrase